MSRFYFMMNMMFYFPGIIISAYKKEYNNYNAATSLFHL